MRSSGSPRPGTDQNPSPGGRPFVKLGGCHLPYGTAYCDHAGSFKGLAGWNRTETAGPHPGRLDVPGVTWVGHDEKPVRAASTSAGSVSRL